MTDHSNTVDWTSNLLCRALACRVQEIFKWINSAEQTVEEASGLTNPDHIGSHWITIFPLWLHLNDDVSYRFIPTSESVK